MPWKYTVEECTTERHDGECGPWKAADIAWGGEWRNAYRKADSLPHAIVTSAYTGPLDYGKTPHTVFEHVNGGGVCDYCREDRGPLCKTPKGNAFICDDCRAGLRRTHEQTSRQHGVNPDRWLYVPIIETLDFE